MKSDGWRAVTSQKYGQRPYPAETWVLGHTLSPECLDCVHSTVKIKLTIIEEPKGPFVTYILEICVMAETTNRNKAKTLTLFLFIEANSINLNYCAGFASIRIECISSSYPSYSWTGDRRLQTAIVSLRLRYRLTTVRRIRTNTASYKPVHGSRQEFEAGLEELQIT